MTLNKQGPGKIDWTDYTWNPISGCKHGCNYCYMLRMEKRFKDIMKPTFHKNRLNDINNLKKPSNIFVGSSGDMWGQWVSKDWIQTVLNIIIKYPQHNFQFLTKNPKRYGNFNLPENGIYGTTIDGTEKTIWNLRILLQHISWSVQPELKVFVSFEPLLKRIPFHTIINDFEFINWIIIGANSNKGADKPPLHWAGGLIALAEEFGIPVFIKNNYFYPDKFKEIPL